MIKIFITTFLCLLISTQLVFGNSNPMPIYQLKEVYKNKNFDYKWIKEIDNIEIPYPKDGSYQIADLKLKKGNYTILKFISSQWGAVSYSDKPVLIHEVLWLKIDNELNILDAYHYTLEWQDTPSIRLYRMKQSVETKLKHPFDIKQLKLQSQDKGLMDIKGILDPHYKNKKFF